MILKIKIRFLRKRLRRTAALIIFLKIQGVAAIAVIEAKRFAVDPASAKQQAFHTQNPSMPVLFSYQTAKRFTFGTINNGRNKKLPLFSRNVILRKIQTLRLEQTIVSYSIPEKYYKGRSGVCPGPYQKEARCRLRIRPLREANAKCLVVMATRTGKTDTIALYLKRLFRAGLANRALFWRIALILGVQTKEVFDEILKDYPSKLLYGGKQRDESSIIISTLPTLCSQLSLFTSGYFDVIISDEAHRSIFWNL